MAQSNEKMKNLVLYICHKCDNPSKLGKTKMNKIFWNIDALMFRHTGETVSGAKYVKKQLGPVPVGIDDVVKSLEATEDLVIRKTGVVNYVRTEFFAKTPPDLSLFSNDEIRLIDFVTEEICNRYTAEEISEKSHNRVWEAAVMGQEIPIYAVLSAYEGEITSDDQAWLDEKISLLKGAAA